MKKIDLKDPEALKRVVREKYGRIARGTTKPTAASPPEKPCCGPRTSSCCSSGSGPGPEAGYTEDIARLKGTYESLEGHVAEADLGLGCGVPTEHAGLEPGMTVVDLGSGAGNDVFIARAAVGDTGRVIGVDMTPEMIAKARQNAARLGTRNVEFRLGEIEALPVETASTDVVLSNCVLNLVPDKRRAFAEIFRILKPGGRFCVSDIVIDGELPPAMREAAEVYSGCVGGALQAEEYLGIIREAGFSPVDVRSAKPLDLPDEALLEYVSPETVRAYRDSGARVLSITVVGHRPRS